MYAPNAASAILNRWHGYIEKTGVRQSILIQVLPVFHAPASALARFSTRNKQRVSGSVCLGFAFLERPFYFLLRRPWWTAKLGLVRDLKRQPPQTLSMRRMSIRLQKSHKTATCHPSILANPPILMFRLSLRPFDCAVYL